MTSGETSPSGGLPEPHRPSVAGAHPSAPGEPTASEDGPVRLTGWANRTLGGLCAAILATITAVLLVQVVMRYGLRSPLVWVDEVTRILMVWLTFLGAALAYRTDSHIGIPALREAVRARGRPWLEGALRLLVDLVVLAGSGALLVGGVIVLERTWGHTTPAMQLPIAVLFTPAPLCGAIVLCSSVAAWSTRILPRARGAEAEHRSATSVPPADPDPDPAADRPGQASDAPPDPPPGPTSDDRTEDQP